jgi:Undecaprenyl-phosphate galactose phosphotransferase WbaP
LAEAETPFTKTCAYRRASQWRNRLPRKGEPVSLLKEKGDLYRPDRRTTAPVSGAGHLLRYPARAWRQGLVTLTLVSSDVLLAVLVWLAAFQVQGVWGRGEPSEISAALVEASVGMWVGLRALLGLYPGYGLDQAEELRRQTYTVVATLAITSVFALAVHVGDLISRLLLVSGFLGLLLLAPLLRAFVKQVMMRAGVWGKPVVILGAGENGARLVRALKRDWGLGFRPIAVFDNRLAPTSGTLEGVPYGGTLTDAMGVARKRVVDTAILATFHARRGLSMKFISRVNDKFRYVIVVPNTVIATTSAATARDLGGILGLETRQSLWNPWARRVKRALDLFGVLAGGLFVSTLLLLIGALIKLDSPGPVFYGQLRPGAGGRYFCCWKLRTMRTDAESLLTELLRTDADLRAEWESSHKLRDDPRITRVGRFLRRTSLDELPQIWNVLWGEMSLVGPRPILIEEIAKYDDIYELYKRMRPGITGLWQVSGRGDISHEERIAMVAYYVRTWSIWLDLVILARTVRSVIFSRGAF